MIDLAKAKAAKVSDVPLGHLVVHAFGPEQLYAIRVEAPFGDADERHSLLVLRVHVQSPRRETVLFSDIGTERCFHIGEPVVAWDGHASSIATLESLSRGSSPLVVTPDGLVVVGRGGPQLRDTIAWTFATGKSVRVTRGYAINKWQIGVAGLQGRFVSLLIYPDDYESSD